MIWNNSFFQYKYFLVFVLLIEIIGGILAFSFWPEVCICLDFCNCHEIMRREDGGRGVGRDQFPLVSTTIGQKLSCKNLCFLSGK